MSILSTTTKGTLAARGAKGAIKRPQLVWAGARAVKPAAKLGIKAGKPVGKKLAERRIERVADTARTWAEAVTKYGPPAARELGLVQPQETTHTARDLAAGAVLGATAVYFLEPEHGGEHRDRIRRLVS